MSARMSARTYSPASLNAPSATRSSTCAFRASGSEMVKAVSGMPRPSAAAIQPGLLPRMVNSVRAGLGRRRPGLVAGRPGRRSLGAPGSCPGPRSGQGSGGRPPRRRLRTGAAALPRPSGAHARLPACLPARRSRARARGPGLCSRLLSCPIRFSCLPLSLRGGVVQPTRGRSAPGGRPWSWCHSPLGWGPEDRAHACTAPGS